MFNIKYNAIIKFGEIYDFNGKLEGRYNAFTYRSD